MTEDQGRDVFNGLAEDDKKKVPEIDWTGKNLQMFSSTAKLNTLNDLLDPFFAYFVTKVLDIQYKPMGFPPVSGRTADVRIATYFHLISPDTT